MPLNLPNNITEHDEKLLKSMLKIDGVCKTLYDHSSYLVFISNYNKESDELNCYAERINFFGTIDNLMVKDDIQVTLSSLSMINHIPLKEESYSEFKETSITAPWFIDGKLNSEHLLIANLAKSNIEPIDPHGTLIVFNPQVDAFVFYTEGEEHPFSYIKNGNTFRSDSLDMLYKIAFDHSEFKTKSSIAFTERLNSEEGEKALQETVNKIMAQLDSVKLFFESSRFSELLDIVVKSAANDESSLNSSDCLNLGFNDEDEFFLFFDAAYNQAEPVQDEDAYFTTFFCIYKGLKFSKTHGQGTIYYINKASD